MQEKINRYPGVLSFTEKEKEVFFGRDLDTEKLSDLISVRNQVLLYAKSGIGKSSLLSAGVLPLLSSSYPYLKIRFNAWISKDKEGPKQENSNTSPQDVTKSDTEQLSPVQVVINLLKAEEENQVLTVLDKLIKGSDYKKTLWYYFKQKRLRGDTSTWLLVFDQFEELFTYPDKDINEFKGQLYEITQVYIADELLRLISEKQTTKESDEYDCLYDPLKVKFVYAIRSDRLELLNRLSDKISNIQRDFYELKPLDEKQATLAITEPAKKEGEEYKSPVFYFEPEAVKKILSALTSKSTKTIETTQLQIVCSRIEKSILASQLTEKTLAGWKTTGILTLTVDDIPDFKDIFNEYYNDAINTLPEKERIKAKKFIEDELISDKQRISFDIVQCKDDTIKEILSKLVPTHLLRCEKNSIGHDSYELSHDTLVEPILASAKVRKDKEEIKELKEK